MGPGESTRIAHARYRVVEFADAGTADSRSTSVAGATIHPDRCRTQTAFSVRYEDVPWYLGNCIGTDPEVWFPEGKTGWRDDAGTKRICAQCDIKRQCLEWAFENNEVGWWGGRYFGQRRKTEDDEHAEQIQPGGDGGTVSDVWRAAA
jgi:WhiB family transcriptional regulator, redox-sensing transcriptional regulator